MDRNDKLERAIMLVDVLSRHCDDVSVFCESLIAVEQQRVVDKFFTSKDTACLQTSGANYTG